VRSDRDGDTSHNRGNFHDEEGAPGARSCCPFPDGWRIRAPVVVVAVWLPVVVVLVVDSRFRDSDTPRSPASDRGFAFGFVVEKHDTGGASLSEVDVEEEGAAIAALLILEPVWADLLATERGARCAAGTGAAFGAGSGLSSRLVGDGRSDALGGDGKGGNVAIFSGPVDTPVAAALPV
jgi:hypothetical protein